MIDFLDRIDRALFLFLNGNNTPFMDDFMFFCSQKFVWAPFYLILLIIIALVYRRRSFLILLIIVIIITLADQASVHLFKNIFMRLRPCHDPDLSGLVHLVHNKCGGLYGFVSSHAANSGALATFIILILRRHSMVIWPVMILWAALVSYSRIYLGVHYPGDVIGGLLLGSLIAWLMYGAYTRIPFKERRKTIKGEN